MYINIAGYILIMIDYKASPVMFIAPLTVICALQPYFPYESFISDPRLYYVNFRTLNCFSRH